MAVTMEEITKLRKMTGAGMMDCKNALNEAESNFDKAMEIIRKKGQAVAAKRSDREASEGCVLAASKSGFGAIVALKCETDFVAKNADFIALTQVILNAALEHKPSSIEALLALTVDGNTVAQLIVDRIGATGEKMELGYYECIEAAYAAAYIHPGNKLATIVGFNQETENNVGKDVAMQIAAMNPISLSRAEMPADVVAKELDIAKDKARQEGKAEEMLDRIAEGRLNKFYQEAALLEQSFIKDSKITIAAYLKSVNSNLTATGFKRVTLNVE